MVNSIEGENFLPAIRVQRRRMSLTQKALADAAGVSIGMIRDLEQGRTVHPTSKSLDRLAAVLCLDGAALVRPDCSDEPEVMAGPLLTAAQIPSPGLQIQILGPLAVSMDGVEVALGGGKHRAMLALLALRANSSVHRDMITDVLWGDNPPDSAAPLVYTYAARLARLLGGTQRQGHSPIVRNGACFSLHADGDMLDSLVAERLNTRARAAVAAGDLDTGCALYEQSLALWHAEPLCDVLVLEGNALREGMSRRWTTSVVEFAEACFVNGWYERCLPILDEVTKHHPLNERVQADLMTALAGMGRQAEALAVYDAVARRLNDDFGVTPSRMMTTTLRRIQLQRIPPRQRSNNAWLGASSRSQMRQRCLATG